MSETYRYDERVLEALGRHGLKPLPHTAPGRLRDAVLDLYKYEIRRLRGDLLAKRFRRQEYAGQVIALRRRYGLLSVPIERWVLGEGQGKGIGDRGKRRPDERR